MKLIVAVIESEYLEDVAAALDQPGMFLFSVSLVGDATAPARTKWFRGSEYRVLQYGLRLEIVVVNDAAVSAAIQAVGLADAARARRAFGSGSILVLPLDDCARPDRATSSTVTAVAASLPRAAR